ncbi:unnamed protein product [Caenorhabditis angaria]|uniref:SCP domain-containing protein n=1 Tax=Caenorhabditis angaria TaxID=860376 RepID=A0A9P1IPH1_9PELO|nr:unnamed protein product [Caenorhabditis angaria]
MILPIFLIFLISISIAQNPLTTFSEDIINLHNKMRSANSMREEFQLITATNMRKMKWNESLIHNACNQDVCYFHNYRDDFTSSQIVRSLWEPIKSELIKLGNYQMLYITSETWENLNPMMKFAIQMIWAEASQVGCVIQKHVSLGSYLYCAYDVSVKPQAFIYEAGIPCSKCLSMRMQLLELLVGGMLTFIQTRLIASQIPVEVRSYGFCQDPKTQEIFPVQGF